MLLDEPVSSTTTGVLYQRAAQIGTIHKGGTHTTFFKQATSAITSPSTSTTYVTIPQLPTYSCLHLCRRRRRLRRRSSPPPSEASYSSSLSGAPNIGYTLFPSGKNSYIVLRTCPVGVHTAYPPHSNLQHSLQITSQHACSTRSESGATRRRRRQSPLSPLNTQLI